MKKDEHLTNRGKRLSRVALVLPSGAILAASLVAARAIPPSMLALSPPHGGLVGPLVKS